MVRDFPFNKLFRINLVSYIFLCFFVAQNIVEHNGDQLLKFLQNRDGNFPDLWMGGRAGPQLEEVPPFPEVHGDDDLRLQAVWQHGPGFLWRGSHVDQLHVAFLDPAHGVHPYAHLCRVVFPVEGADERQLVAELVVGVVAVPGTLLRVAGDAVADDFMGHAPVTGNTYRHLFVFDDGFVAALDDAGDEFPGRVGVDLVLAFVAGPSGPLDVLQDFLAVYRHDFKTRFDDFHTFCSFRLSIFSVFRTACLYVSVYMSISQYFCISVSSCLKRTCRKTFRS